MDFKTVLKRTSVRQVYSMRPFQPYLPLLGQSYLWWNPPLKLSHVITQGNPGYTLGFDNPGYTLGFEP